MSDLFIERLRDRLLQELRCHTVILYGSRARGDFGPTSDYDIMGIRPNGKKIRRAWLEKGAYVDMFVWPEKLLKKPDSSLLYMLDGKVLAEKNGFGTKFLKKLKRIHDKGPERMSEEDKEFRRTWIKKMLERIRHGDLEANYRRCWLQNSLLEDYFVLRDLWYLGSKKGFEYLRTEDTEMHRLFEKVYGAPGDLKALEKLAARI